MALLALHPSGIHEVLMIKARAASEQDVPLGGLVTQGAAADGVEFPGRFLAFEVAEKARDLRHLDMSPDHDLGVTAGAAELPTAPRLLQVRAMVENDPTLERDLALQEASRMALKAQTAGILDLGERLAAVGLCGPLRHLG